MLRRRRFFAGDAAPRRREPVGDIEWLMPDGEQMDEDDLARRLRPRLMVFLNGDAIPEPDLIGRRVVDDHFLMLFNAHFDAITFTMPPKAFGNHWQIRLDTAPEPVDPVGGKPWRARSRHAVPGHSMVVLSTAVVPEEERQAAEAGAAMKGRSPRRRQRAK